MDPDEVAMIDKQDEEPTGHGLTCWLLDTRSLWPGEKITDSESVCTPHRLHYLAHIDN
jgi:hypothetical protein